MVNKEIIIDGVDVSNCVYLPYCEDKQGNCGNNPNCYYKQLQRKIIECDKYKQALNEIEQFCIELSDYDLAEETAKLILEIIDKNKANGGE